MRNPRISLDELIAQLRLESSTTKQASSLPSAVSAELRAFASELRTRQEPTVTYDSINQVMGVLRAGR